MLLKKSAVAVHGCHTGAVGWENIIWGSPQNNVLGRAAKGIALAEDLGESLEFLSWSTGASERGGKKESELIYEHALKHVQEVPGLDTFSLSENHEWLESKSVIDTTTQNTREEIENIGRLCTERGVENLYLVSSPWHIQRCLKEALVLRAEGKMGNVEIFAVASDDSSEALSAKQVVILEPPHRGDDPSLNADVQMHKVIPGLFKASPERREIILKKVLGFLDIPGT